MSARSGEQGTRRTKKKKEGAREYARARARPGGWSERNRGRSAGDRRDETGHIAREIARSAAKSGAQRHDALPRASARGGENWREGARARSFFFFFWSGTRLTARSASAARRGASGGGGSGSSREAPPRRRRGAQLRTRAFARTSSRSHHRRPSRPRPGPPPPPRSRRALRGAKKKCNAVRFRCA